MSPRYARMVSERVLEMNAGPVVASDALVTVIIPTHNREMLLRRSVASVLAQTHRNLELIVVDDGSVDGTADFLATVTDSRVRVVTNPRGTGAAAARNLGLGMARGDYIGFQDDDDYWLVGKLEKQLAALAGAPDKSWCLGAYIRLEPAGVTYFGGEHFCQQVRYDRGIGEGGPDWYLITTPNWLVKRELLLELAGFDERLRSWDDWELSLRIRQRTDFVHVAEPLWIQDRIEGGGLTKAERARADDMRLILQKHGTMWVNQPRVLARHFYVIGRAENQYDGTRGAGRAMLWKAVRTAPGWPKPWLALLLSCIPATVAAALTAGVRGRRVARHAREVERRANS